MQYWFYQIFPLSNILLLSKQYLILSEQKTQGS